MTSDREITNEEDWVEIECREPASVRPAAEEDDGQRNSNPSEILISTSEISTWDLTTVVNHRVIAVKASRSRLFAESSYFRGLLSGCFSESQRHRLSVEWSIDIFLDILKFICGCQLEITFQNFLPLYEGALYFGVEKLLLEWKTWFSDNFSEKMVPSSQIQLNYLDDAWNYSLEHGIDIISRTCTSYIARNFMWAVACDSFLDLSYSLLFSSLKHPHLTIDSERHLFEALLAWIHANVEDPEHLMNPEVKWVEILEQVRIQLLPMWFLMGKQKCCYSAELVERSIGEICMVCVEEAPLSDLKCWIIRLTGFTEKLDLSGCPQISSTVLLNSLLPSSDDLSPMFIGRTREELFDLKLRTLDSISTPQHSLKTLSFESVLEIDLSRCPKFHLSSVLTYLGKSFPSLRTLKACQLLEFETRDLLQLQQKCPSISEVDLTVDLSPTIPSQIPFSYFEFENKRMLRRYSGVALSSFRQIMSNLTKLTLKGRTDFRDIDLCGTVKSCVMLSYLNIKGCLSLTDLGISNVLRICNKLHSLVACDTLFGKNSMSALSTRCLDSDGSTHLEEKNLMPSSVFLEVLHIGGCKGVDESSIQEIMSHPWTQELKSLCLRDICVGDTSFHNFQGCSLEMLDVSNTMMSGAALSRIISGNPKLRCLKARGCKGLRPQSKDDHDLYPLSEMCVELGKTCILDKLEIGWGFSSLWLEKIGPAIGLLKSMAVGLGGSLGEEGLMLLPTLCPKLESLCLLFQVISDCAMVKVVKTLTHLQVLEVCYCMGDITPACFKFCLPNLRKLRLERVVPWMTNTDLTLLTQHMPNLIELSFIGCRLLDAGSQQIISWGWPGLISLHLEECGSVTSEGVVSLYDCKALEDLLLRHNGRGINRNIILESASKLPMLRKLSLDWCDALDGEFDLPNFVHQEFESAKEVCAQRNLGAFMEQLMPPEDCCQGKNSIIDKQKLTGELLLCKSKARGPIHSIQVSSECLESSTLAGKRNLCNKAYYQQGKVTSFRGILKH